MKIGCIGQGFVGKHISDYLEAQGHAIVRYSLEKEFVANKTLIAKCGMVFIAVPTPTTPEGFDDSSILEAISLISDGSIAVIKSTSLPGTADKMQAAYPGKIIISSPEFLSEVSAAYDVTNPILQIVGLTAETNNHKVAAKQLTDLMPSTKNTFIVTAKTAELFKYTHNVHGYFRILLTNLLYDIATEIDVDWSDIERIIAIDPMMSPYYNTAVHKGGRGAGGNCFIKDMAAFREFYEKLVRDDKGIAVLKALEMKNLEMLQASDKCKDLIEGVYGKKSNL